MPDRVLRTPVLSALPPRVLVHSLLHIQSKPLSRKVLASRLRQLIDGDALGSSLEELAAEALVQARGASWELSTAGSAEAHARFGNPTKRGHLEALVWPALVLGLDPADPSTAPLASVTSLRAVTLAALYGVPVDPKRVTLNSVVAALISRGLSHRPAHCVQRQIGLEPVSLASAADLRRQLLRVGLELAALDTPSQPAVPPEEAVPAQDPVSIDVFAERVLATIAGLPPGLLRDSVPVADVYDAYRETYEGTGELPMFKERLLEAQRARLLALRQLDRPQALPDALRQRSEISGKRHPLHLILRPRRS